MVNGIKMVLAFAAAVVFGACPLAADPDGAGPQGAPSKPRTFFLAVGKGMAGDPAAMQQRAIDAVEKVTGAAKGFRPGIVVDALAEAVMTKEQFRGGKVEAKVSGEVFRKRLRELARITTAQDTVIVYTHSHGVKEGRLGPNRLGGMVLNPGVPGMPGRAVLPWDEYAELILAIPARNVVVLTMSCYSGGMVEHLNSPTVRPRWAERQQKQGRNFIVLTSQNAELKSPPIVKDREPINPFTYAVARALAGKADGFVPADGKPNAAAAGDGKLTVGELVDYILHTTEHTASEFPRRANIAKPRLTGSFDRRDVLIEGGGKPQGKAIHAPTP